MFVKLKQCLRKNSKINFWVELYKNRKDKMFQDYVTAFGGSDSVWLSHPGTLYPEHLVYCITNHKGDMGFFGEVCRTLRRLAYVHIKRMELFMVQIMYLNIILCQYPILITKIL